MIRENIIAIIIVFIVAVAFTGWAMFIYNGEPTVTLTQQQQLLTQKQNEINVREIVRLEQLYNTLFNQYQTVSKAFEEVARADTVGFVKPIMNKYKLSLKPQQQ